MKHYSNCELCLRRKPSNEIFRCQECYNLGLVAVHCKKCSLEHNSLFTHKSEYRIKTVIGYIANKPNYF